MHDPLKPDEAPQAEAPEPALTTAAPPVAELHDAELPRAELPVPELEFASPPAAESTEAVEPAPAAHAEVAPGPCTEAAEAEPTPAGSAEPGAAAPAIADLSPAACGAALAERFPAVFGAGVAQPLKLRIQADIQQRAPGVFTRKALSAFLHRHTTGNAYLRALAKATQRVDLDGQPAGEVAPEHRDAAQAELERRRGIHQQRRAEQIAAERAAQREAQRAREAQQQAQREAGEVEGRARAERAALLRAHDASTLTRKNFCALKGIAEDALDALLDQARRERAQNLQPRPMPAGAPAPGSGAPPQRHRAANSGPRRS